jgi:hypothetical protein
MISSFSKGSAIVPFFLLGMNLSCVDMEAIITRMRKEGGQMKEGIVDFFAKILSLAILLI